MLVVLVLMALLAIIGATSLSIAGVDQRVATHNRRHMMALNTAVAGTEHARFLLGSQNPADEGWDTTAPFVPKTDSEASFEGIAFPMNQGVYEVSAVYQRCAGAPPGYSAEVGKGGYRSDYWDMRSRATFDDPAFEQTNPTQAVVVSTLRKVVRGSCKIR